MSIILQLTTVFVAAFTTTGAWLWLASRYRWLDHPNPRSSHHLPTPRGGGIGVAVGFFCYLLWDQTLFSAGGWWLVLAGVTLLLTGLVDDLFTLRARTRLFLQAAAVSFMWPFFSLLPELHIADDFHLSGNWLAFAVSLTMVAWINLFNFMDGIDALAASEAVFFSMSVILLTTVSGQHAPDLSALGLGVAVCGFLYFNLPRARIFMGDAGSYFIAFAMAVCGLLLVQQSGLDWWALLIISGTFVVDSTTTLLGRLLSGAVWYHPHKTHAYQLLAAKWGSHGRVVMWNAGINLLWLLPIALWAARDPDLGPVLLLLAWLPLVALVAILRSMHAYPHKGD